ncbi:hypothetical protein IFM89_024826 [Coptis chinensis]|uniref:Uncharacterized protein n=1 Tax=Coptis chinensis TaxID=261450 RepID=A0A835HPA3_9MAGN|nr:hypothetical protein IFM89_024826 [Coptis chinensis]
MFKNFLSVRRLTPPFFRSISPKAASATELKDEGQSALKIIHAGGIVEFYYMAVPAVSIMEKYPSFLLARPEIFRRPWDSLVRPEEILIPGERVYVVPRRTVKKLQRRIRRPIIVDVLTKCSSSWQSSSDISGESIQFSSKSIAAKSKISGGNDKSINTLSSSFSSMVSTCKSKSVKPREGDVSSIVVNSQCSKRSRKKLHKSVMWNPTLTVIHEGSPAHGANNKLPMI